MATISQQFTLYASHGRVYAENAVGKLIDLGAVRKEGNLFVYRLDADGVSGEASESFARALSDIENRITFLYMDSQFTALPDLRGKVDLSADTPTAVITLADTVAVPQAGGGDTPHIF
jgi:hypothetical protein